MCEITIFVIAGAFINAALKYKVLKYKYSFRFRENAKLLRSEMDAIGFQNIIDPADNPNGYIVSTFHYPDNSRFIFERFYEKLSEAGAQK